MNIARRYLASIFAGLLFGSLMGVAVADPTAEPLCGPSNPPSDSCRAKSNLQACSDCCYSKCSDYPVGSTANNACVSGCFNGSNCAKKPVH